MSGRRSRDKGARTERAIAKVLQANGFAAAKISSAYQPGHDIVLSLSGRDLCVEVKARAGGFQGLYSWLSGRDLLIVKADRQEPLVILRLSLAAEIAKAGSGTNVGVR
jgi:Holliday junction resolvase-like predicted endonuclease